MISLDRGGVRGIIQLGLLQALERRFRGISIAQISDLCIGISISIYSVIAKEYIPWLRISDIQSRGTFSDRYNPQRSIRRGELR